jgi:tetratricopeptide (TPR) repeat protein
MRALLILVVIAGVAHAEPKAEALFEQGQAKYLADEFQAAIELFKQAYAIEPDPVYLFNIAQSYRKVADCENAFDFYTRYLTASPNAENKAKVDAWLREMQPCVEQRKREHEAAKRGEEAERQRKADEARRAAAPKPVATVVDRGRPYRIAGIVSVGLGAVFIAGGVRYSLAGAHARDQLAKLCAAGCDWQAPQVHALDQQGQADNSHAAVGWVVGGVALAAGVGIYLYGRSHVEHVMLVPTAGGAAVSAGLRF